MGRRDRSRGGSRPSTDAPRAGVAWAGHMTTKQLETDASPAAAIGTAALAIVTAAVSLTIGPTDDYARIFPPRWLTFIAATLLVVALLAERSAAPPRRRRGGGVLGWAAAVFFFGASGGVILDGFRAFFRATGIPAGEFATVDWPGALARAASLFAALATVLWTSRLRARKERTPEGTRPATSTFMRTALAWSAVAFTVPYPLLKLVWWAQDASGRAAADRAGFPVMELLAFGAALLLVLLLTSSLPLPLPAWLLITGGWIASMALLSMGFLMVFGLLAQATGVAAGSVSFTSGGATLLVSCVYATWLLLGLVTLVATLAFVDDRRSRRAQLVERADAIRAGAPPTERTAAE